MKKFFVCFILALCLTAACAFAQAEPLYDVILPEGYDEGTARYPVVYVLPQESGAADDSALASLYAAQDGMDVIIVKPVLTTGNASAELAAVISSVDAQYRTVADPEHRALIGTGTGGYLAYALGLEKDSPAQMMATVRGDMTGGAALWQAGDVYAMAGKTSPGKFETLYTYMDAPVDDEWTAQYGSTADLGSMFIEMGTPAASHEFSLRPGTFDEAFLAESACRIADRLTSRMLSGIASGSVSLENSSVSAAEETVCVEFSAQTTSAVTVYASDITCSVVLKVVDPSTGETLAETDAGMITGESMLSGSVYVPNIVRGESSDIVLVLRVLGGETELSRASLLRAQDAVIDGDVQKIELAGDWYFKYTGKDKIDVAALSADEYETWHTVQPGMSNWAKGYGNIDETTVQTGFGGADYFNYMITGNGYYARSFYVPAEFDSDDLILSIGYVDDRCEVFLNGVKIGSTGMTEEGEPNNQTTWSEYSKFAIDETLLVRGGNNLVVVRAWNDMPYGAGGWYAGPIGLYSRAAMNGGSSSSCENERLIEKTFLSEYAAKAMRSEEPLEKEYYVYLPEGYETSGRRYPTVYLLHQFNSDHTSYQADKIDQLLDEGIAAGLFDEMIVVIPNSDGNSWWAGDWEKMLTEELVPLIDSEYRTVRDARYRLTAGCSMGGQGAYSVALHNPGVFSGAVSFYGAFSYGGDNDPNTIAQNESAEFMDYFSFAFICGNQDSYGFGAPAISLHKRLLNMGVEHFFLIDNGGHDSGFYVPFFADCFGFVRGDMFSADASVDTLLSGSVSENGVITWTADEALLSLRNTIPASSYLPQTTQDIDFTFSVRAVKDGETVFERHANATVSQTCLSGEIALDLSGADITGCELILTAQLFDRAIPLN